MPTQKQSGSCRDSATKQPCGCDLQHRVPTLYINNINRLVSRFNVAQRASACPPLPQRTAGHPPFCRPPQGEGETTPPDAHKIAACGQFSAAPFAPCRAKTTAFGGRLLAMARGYETVYADINGFRIRSKPHVLHGRQALCAWVFRGFFLLWVYKSRAPAVVWREPWLTTAFFPFRSNTIPATRSGLEAAH
jgi:hypothetical protein